ncbi:zinc-binding dehydrogenase [Nonomuraea sp. CA-141351]|uniref:zinc-binding dehydrogenase n=1 Tax=Nonomuraea sp. CA-141351 TaxID=3239996 RepID=UPI003D8F2CAD
MMISREIHLVRHPEGKPRLSDFRLVETSLSALGDDQVLVRNRYFALAAVMRTLMSGADIGMPLGTYRPGHALFGSALGEVVDAGRAAKCNLRAGDLVLHHYGWRDYVVESAARFRRVPPDALPDPILHLNQGLTAYAGLIRVARMRPGDIVFVSGAAGAVGTMAGQIARLKEAGRVIGSAGSPAKLELLTGRLGYDAAFDHHDSPVVDRLREAAPDGIDVYFDNVGGEQLAAALELARPGARFALCGALKDQLGDTSAAVPVDPAEMIGKRLTMAGFHVADHRDLHAAWSEDFGGWLRAGRIEVPQVVVPGLEAAPGALLSLLRGEYAGMVVVSVV